MKKVLVAYATWSGATGEVAARIGNILRTQNFDVDIIRVQEVKDISEYNAVIVGTSIHAGNTVGKFRKFLSRFYQKLSSLSVAYFVVCANMMEDKDENREETAAWLNKATSKFPQIKPISIGLFGGAVLTQGKEYENLNFIIKKIISSMKSKMEEDYGKSDFRDWKKIEKWGLEVSERL